MLVNVILNVVTPDHILSLQQALAHYEWTLAQSHPIYHTQLHIRAVKTKGKGTKAAIILTVISIGVVLIQTLIGECEQDATILLRLMRIACSLGIFSMNCTVPSNGKLPDDPLYLFGTIVVSAFVLIFIYLSFVRHLWRSAKKRTQKSVF